MFVISRTAVPHTCVSTSSLTAAAGVAGEGPAAGAAPGDGATDAGLQTARPGGTGCTIADQTVADDDDAFADDPLQRDGVGSAGGFGQFVDRVSCRTWARVWSKRTKMSCADVMYRPAEMSNSPFWLVAGRRIDALPRVLAVPEAEPVAWTWRSG